VLRRTFGYKRKDVAGGCRTLDNEKFHNLYASPNIRVIKSRRMRRVGHVARTGQMRNTYKYWSENLKARDHLEEAGVDAKIM